MSNISLTLFLCLIHGCWMYGFKSFPYKIKWDIQSSSEDIVFSTEHALKTRCALECSLKNVCKFTLIYDGRCYGLSNLKVNASLQESVEVFVRQFTECSPSMFISLDGYCLYMKAIKLSWFEARDFCQRQNGSLLALDTEHKHSAMQQLLTTYYPYNSFYVGATDEQREGDWIWMTLDAQSYFPWVNGQPNNNDNSYVNEPANCAMYSIDKNAMWDEYCYAKKHFICEKQT